MKKIFVLGAGTMGAGIVQAFAQKGYEVIVRDIKDEFVERFWETQISWECSLDQELF